MSNAKIRSALYKRMRTLAQAQGWFEALENIPNPNTAVKIVEPRLVPYQVQNPSFGVQHQRRTGVLRVLLKFQTLTKGLGDLEAAAELIVAHFPRGLTLNEGGLSVFVEYTPTIYPALIDGMYNVIPVDIYYRAEIIATN